MHTAFMIDALKTKYNMHRL